MFIRGHTAQKMKFSIKYFFSECDQISAVSADWTHLQKRSLMENFIFCVVANRQSDSVLKELRILIDLPRAPGENLCVTNSDSKTDTFITKVIQKLRNVLQALRKGSKGDSLLIS